MAKTRFTGVSWDYIFDGAGGMRDQLEQTILQTLQQKQYPLQANIQEIKAGVISGLFKSGREQCVVIQIDKESQIAISNTTVGTYLYVQLYFMVQEKNVLFQALSSVTDNIFKQQKRSAVFEAARQATEASFAALGLKQSNYGYNGNKTEISSEE